MEHYKLVVNGKTVCETDDIFEAWNSFFYDLEDDERIGHRFEDCCIVTEVA